MEGRCVIKVQVHYILLLLTFLIKSYKQITAAHVKQKIGVT
jgi:hypothetical protein